MKKRSNFEICRQRAAWLYFFFNTRNNNQITLPFNIQQEKNSLAVSFSFQTSLFSTSFVLTYLIVQVIFNSFWCHFQIDILPRVTFSLISPLKECIELQIAFDMSLLFDCCSGMQWTVDPYERLLRTYTFLYETNHVFMLI